jgi:GNAT superfamily N-acetyltransferase
MEITLDKASIKVNPFINPDLSDDVCEKLRYLSHLYVEPEYRKQGQASALLEKVIKESTEAGLSLVVEPKPYGDGIDQLSLTKFYAKHGFTQIQREPLIMVRFKK